MKFSCIPPDTQGLGDWYANLLRIELGRCVLATNEKALYSLLIPKLKRVSMNNIIDEFLFNLSMNLKAEGKYVTVP